MISRSLRLFSTLLLPIALLTAQEMPKPHGEHRRLAQCVGVFDFTAGRGRDGPRNFLGDFSGRLQVDAYAGYDAALRDNRIDDVGCWAHARRKRPVYPFLVTPAEQRALPAISWRRPVADRAIRTVLGSPKRDR